MNPSEERGDFRAIAFGRGTRIDVVGTSSALKRGGCASLGTGRCHLAAMGVPTKVSCVRAFTNWQETGLLSIDERGNCIGVQDASTTIDLCHGRNRRTKLFLRNRLFALGVRILLTCVTSRVVLRSCEHIVSYNSVFVKYIRSSCMTLY